MIAKIRYHSENSSCSEFSLFRHCSIASYGYYSISSCFDILHSRLAEIDRKPYEIDGNQPEFVMIGLTWLFGFQFLQKLKKNSPECDQKYNRDPNMSIGFIITISTQKALKTY